MKIETFEHLNVKPDGTFEDKKGAVETEGRFTVREDILLVHIVAPRTEDGIVRGMNVVFDSIEEMIESLQMFN